MAIDSCRNEPELATMDAASWRSAGRRAQPPWVTESGTTGGGDRSCSSRAAAVQMSTRSMGPRGRTASPTPVVQSPRLDLDGDRVSAETGLLTDDYARKPAFGAYRQLIARFDAGYPQRPPSMTFNCMSERDPGTVTLDGELSADDVAAIAAGAGSSSTGRRWRGSRATARCWRRSSRPARRCTGSAPASARSSRTRSRPSFSATCRSTCCAATPPGRAPNSRRRSCAARWRCAPTG